jgi:DNA-binding XRE family transcriptional regulator
MKNIESYDEFLNESALNESKVSTDLQAKFDEKVEIAKMAISKWESDTYKNALDIAQDYASGKKMPTYSDVYMFQGDDKKSSYDVFNNTNAKKLAKQIAKIIKKYKKYEGKSDSIGAAGGWSGTMKASRSGTIHGDTSFSANSQWGGKLNFLIAVKIGSNVNSSAQEKLKQELFQAFYTLDQYNSSDGGVSYNYTTGTNFDTIGLTNSKSQFNDSFTEELKNIMNG